MRIQPCLRNEGFAAMAADGKTDSKSVDLDSSRAESGARAGLEALLAEINENAHCRDLLHPALDVLREYDEAKQTDLFNTLKIYLENDCNAQKCGRILFLHRNSLVYRIHKIQEVSGCDLSDPVERSYLRISFLLWG